MLDCDALCNICSILFFIMMHCDVLTPDYASEGFLHQGAMLIKTTGGVQHGQQ